MIILLDGTLSCSLPPLCTAAGGSLRADQAPTLVYMTQELHQDGFRSP